MKRSLALSAVLLAFLATNAFASGEARLTGTVFDGATKKPIPNPTILVVSEPGSGHNFKQEFKGKADGSYAIFLLDGTIRYKFSYSAPGYTTFEQTIKLTLAPEKNVQDIDLSPAAAAAAVAAPVPQQPTTDPAIAAYNEGAALANAGQVPEAIAKIEEAVSKKPDLTSGYEALARLYIRAKDYPKAIDRANKVLSIDTDNMDMFAVLYEAYTATGDKAKAAEFKKKLPANPHALFNDAAKLINANKDGEAEPLLKQAIAADDKFAQAYYELGMIYVRAGKNADARTNLQKYLELEPNGKDAGTAKEMLNYVK